ncbi:MAG: hypothetical protein AAFN81_04150 [Bacteroidota bacterium]
MSNQNSLHSLWEGTWAYRSYNNYTFEQVKTDSSGGNNLMFGEGTIIISPSRNQNELSGSIGDEKRQEWELKLTGSINYGDPFTARFQGKGNVGGHEWIYEYVGYLVNPWQNGVNQVPAFVGSVIRQIPHPGGDGTIHPAGVVASFFCVKY